MAPAGRAALGAAWLSRVRSAGWTQPAGKEKEGKARPVY